MLYKLHFVKYLHLFFTQSALDALGVLFHCKTLQSFPTSMATILALTKTGRFGKLHVTLHAPSPPVSLSPLEMKWKDETVPIM